MFATRRLTDVLHGLIIACQKTSIVAVALVGFLIVGVVMPPYNDFEEFVVFDKDVAGGIFVPGFLTDVRVCIWCKSCEQLVRVVNASMGPTDSISLTDDFLLPFVNGPTWVEEGRRIWWRRLLREAQFECRIRHLTRGASLRWAKKVDVASSVVDLLLVAARLVRWLRMRHDLDRVMVWNV